MKIDVYIPTYNRKELLEKAIRSVLLQTYPDITIVVSDNASADGTDLMMQERFGDNPKIKYVRQKENVGPSMNFHKCIYEYGTGDFSLFLSDDDELSDPEYIEKAVNCIENNKDICIVIGNTRIDYSDLGIFFDTHASFPSETIPGKEFFLKYGSGSYSISWCNAIFRRDIAIENDCYDAKIFYADSDCFFRILMFGNVGYIDTLASIYRIHAKNSYKIASVSTYLDNENYIQRNYEFAKEKSGLPLSELDQWRDRLLSGYRSTLIDNLTLFSQKPLENLRIAQRALRSKGYHLSFSQKLRIPLLFVARMAIGFKPAFRLLVSRNYKK